MEAIDKERNRLDFIRSTEGIHALMRQETLPDWYVIEYADEFCEMWDDFSKLHGISHKIGEIFKKEIIGFLTAKSPYSIPIHSMLQSNYLTDSYTNISTAKKVFDGYEFNGVFCTNKGYVVSFTDKLYKFKFEIAIDFRMVDLDKMT